jgi:hypothetical protein
MPAQLKSVEPIPEPSPEHDRERGRLAGPLGEALALAALLALALAAYLPYATRAGWFLDDWSIYSDQKQIHGGYLARMSDCMQAIPGGRKLACLYHVTEWSLFGSGRWAYHLLSIAFLATIAGLVYTIARRGGLSRLWALALGAAVIIFPGADSTRLWAVGSIGQYVLALQLTGMLLAIIALGRAPGRRSLPLQILAGTLSVLAMASYEIAVPLVALQGLAFIAIYRNRRALRRWFVDIGLVLAFIVYRLTVMPVDNEALQARRTLGQSASRVELLLRGAWKSWSSLYAPGWVLALGIAIIALSILTAAIDPSARRRLASWGLLLGGAALSAAVCALVYLTADDSYVLVTYSTYNRLNLAGTIPYALSFIALLGLLFELVRRWSPWAAAAPLAVVALGIAVAAHQLSVSDEHKDAWLNSWSFQEKALPGIRDAMRSVPTDSRIFAFDTPQWENGWVPIFAQSWDMWGVISYETRVVPDFASPFDEEVSCQARGVAQANRVVAPYGDREHPVYFVSPSRRVAVEVSSQQRCHQLASAWGYVPLLAFQASD